LKFKITHIKIAKYLKIYYLYIVEIKIDDVTNFMNIKNILIGLSKKNFINSSNFHMSKSSSQKSITEYPSHNFIDNSELKKNI